jgi:hypothetical protein
MGIDGQGSRDCGERSCTTRDGTGRLHRLKERDDNQGLPVSEGYGEAGVAAQHGIGRRHDGRVSCT